MTRTDAPPCAPSLATVPWRRGVLEEDAPDLLDDLGLSLTRVVPPHDQLGDHPVDVGAPVGHDAVVPLLLRAIPLDGDDRVRRNPGRNRDGRQDAEAGVAGAHVVDRRRGPAEGRDQLLVAGRRDGLGEPAEHRHRHGNEPGRERAQPPPGQDGAVVGRRHEHHPLDEGQGGEEHGLLEEGAGLGTDLDLLERLRADAVPELRPAVDRGHLRQQPPLAVADHHHAAERRILALGIELLHRGRQGRPQPTRRVANGVPRVVEKDPDLELLPDPRIPSELVDQLGPAHGTRGRPVHQHHGDLAGPVRLQHEQAVLGAVARQLRARWCRRAAGRQSRSRRAGSYRASRRALRSSRTREAGPVRPP